MATLWFCFLAVMVTMYVVLDGFDLGVGALHLWLAKTPEERQQATAAIGPVWNGNEVWLIAGGGVLFLSFPAAYAGAFSGLYFGLIIVLWLLVGRGLALELRHQINHPLWEAACDAVFCLSSATLALVFGVALGNVVRGVPLGPDGYFSLPLFHILNWYALLIGVFGLTAVAILLQLPTIVGDAPYGALVAFPSRKVAAVFPLDSVLPRAALDVMVNGLDHSSPDALTRTVYWWRGGDELIDLGPDSTQTLHLPDELAQLLC